MPKCAIHKCDCPPHGWGWRCPKCWAETLSKLYGAKLALKTKRESLKANG